MNTRPPHVRRARPAVAKLLIAALALIGLVSAGTACGGEPALELPPDAAQGRKIANENGCAGCHGKNGQGVTAPSWQGLYNSEIELDDGTTVIGDYDYMYTAIVDPQAQIVKDWTLKMPRNSLDDDQIDLIIAYIRALQ